MLLLFEADKRFNWEDIPYIAIICVQLSNDVKQTCKLLNRWMNDWINFHDSPWMLYLQIFVLKKWANNYVLWFWSDRVIWQNNYTIYSVIMYRMCTCNLDSQIFNISNKNDKKLKYTKSAKIWFYISTSLTKIDSVYLYRTKGMLMVLVR